jgi:hypothetical protein
VEYCNVNFRPQSPDWEKDLLDFEVSKVWYEEKKALSSPHYICMYRSAVMMSEYLTGEWSRK